MSRMFSILVPLVFGAGCGGQVTYSVSGSVTYDGQPVADGTIAFLHADHPEWGPDGTTIKNGEYSLRVKPGPSRVEITGNRFVTDPEILRKAGGVPPREDYIPAKHHSASRRTVVISGPIASLDFTLEK